MKKMFLIFSLIAFNKAFAANGLICDIEENLNNNIVLQTLEIPASEDPHGAIFNYNLKTFTQYSGFVALSKGVTVIHIIDNVTGVATSTQSSSARENFARLQIMFGLNELDNKSIVIQCEPVLNN